MKKIVHRINDFSILRLTDNDDVSEFFRVNLQQNTDINQYVELTSEDSTVWDSGEFAHRLNKSYSNAGLFYSTYGSGITLGSLNVGILLKRGFDWSTKFGIHVLIKSSKTEEVFISRLLTVDDFRATGNKELIDGCFWLEEASMNIPKTNDILFVQITTIAYEDVTIDGPQVGYIASYPTEFVPLIDEKPIPDFILNKISIDANHYLLIKILTTENKTVKQSILDYFGLTMSNIEVSHIINYGTEILGFRTLRISNEDDWSLPINIALNLKEFATETNDYVTINVSTEILVDKKMMKRESTIGTSLLSAINPLIQDKIVYPESNFPVNVVFENVINNTIIETPKVTKLVSIYQPIFIEMISESFKIENKYIYFENLTEEASLSIIGSDTNETIYSKITSDNKIYFDLSELKPIDKPTTYELVNSKLQIIGKGIVTI